MTLDQGLAFAIIGGTLALFIWDRLRYDMVALLALLASVLVGLVPADKAFTGFSDPVVTTVGTVLILSAALRTAGVVERIVALIEPLLRHTALQVAVLTVLVSVFSAFMNNIGALAIVLPVALQIAQRSRRSPSELLMPLAFGSLLGGLITLIGTPPNVLISGIRRDIVGEGYSMFDFAPVGLGLTLLGVAYLSVAWRLIPHGRRGAPQPEDMFRVEDYLAEVQIPAGSPLAGKTVEYFEALAPGEVTVTAIIREGFRRYVPSGHWTLMEDDILVIEADPTEMTSLVGDTDLHLVGTKGPHEVADNPEEFGVVEAVVTAGSRMIGCTAVELELRERFGVNLLAVGRRGRPTSVRLRRIKFQLGDVVVLQGNLERMPEALAELGCLPLARRNLKLGQPRKAYLSSAVMAAAVLLSALEVLPVAIAFLAAVLLLVLLRVLTLRDAYEAVNWPILMLLGALIPVADSLQTTGGSELIAGTLAGLAGAIPGWAALAVILVATMAITPVLNNAAAVLVMAPIAASFAAKLGLGIDPFLMAVAVGASCDFLTPIGHQSNTLVMGPGGYRFGDYWRLGLPLSIMIVVVGVPLIMLVWPL